MYFYTNGKESPFNAVSPTLNTPTPKSTHKITIPGTKFIAHVSSLEAANKLAAQLGKTYIPTRPGTRRTKAVAVITNLEADTNSLKVA